MSNQDPAGGNFHIDKRVPVALIIAIFIQTCGAVWWAATLQSTQAQALVDQQRLEARVNRVELQREDISERVIKIEEKLEAQTDTLKDILDAVKDTN